MSHGAGGACAGIMRQVGSQMAAAAEAAAKQAAIDFQQGPYIQQDGLVIIPFIDGMWGFSPAFPPALAGAMAAEEYWSVLLPLNAFSIKTAQENNVADSQGRIMTGMSNQLNAGAAGLGGMMQAAQNAAGEARKANAVRQAIMRQIQPMMLRANQTTAAKGIIWSLEKHTWTTVSTTTDSHHHTSSRTVHHEQYIILLRAKSAAQQLAMVGASNGMSLARARARVCVCVCVCVCVAVAACVAVCVRPKILTRSCVGRVLRFWHFAGGFNAMSVNHAIRGNVPGCVMPKGTSV